MRCLLLAFTLLRFGEIEVSCMWSWINSGLTRFVLIVIIFEDTRHVDIFGVVLMLQITRSIGLATIELLLLLLLL